MGFDFSAIPNADLLIVGVVVAFMAVLGAAVFFANMRSASNRAFLFFCIAASLWSILNYAFYQAPTPDVQFSIIRGVIAIAVWFVFTLFMFMSTFPETKSPFRSTTRMSFALIALGVSALNLSPAVFKRISEYTVDGSIASIENGWGIFVFAAFVFTFVIAGIIAFTRKYVATPQSERAPLQLILGGIVVTFALLLTFNFVLPAFFGNTDFMQYGALFIFPFIAAASWALLKYRFMNPKATTIAMLTGLLAIAIFGEIIFAHETPVLLYRLSEFILVIIFGILLIRSVSKEVEQRERIQLLAEKLKAANERLKELDTLKSQFLSIASHDLRSPLTVIRNFVALVLDGTYGKIPNAAEEGLHQVFDRATDMATSVETYLSVSRIEQGRMKYDFITVDLAPILTKAVADFKVNAEKKGVHLEGTISNELIGRKARLDIAKINEVLNNLLDNSIKYTPNGTISVVARAVGNTAKITITDTGIGMSEETIGKLFQLFSTGTNSLKVNISSTGVGLYITKAHVLAHGGRVWAESDGEGKGSRFIVELPLL